MSGHRGEASRVVSVEPGVAFDRLMSVRLRETLTNIERPHSFAYRLDGIEGPLRHFVHSIDGVWTITSHDGGACIGWAWTFYPKASPARLTSSVIGRMWMGYADRALMELDPILTRG